MGPEERIKGLKVPFRWRGIWEQRLAKKEEENGEDHENKKWVYSAREVDSQATPY